MTTRLKNVSGASLFVGAVGRTVTPDEEFDVADTVAGRKAGTWRTPTAAEVTEKYAGLVRRMNGSALEVLDPGAGMLSQSGVFDYGAGSGTVGKLTVRANGQRLCVVSVTAVGSGTPFAVSFDVNRTTTFKTPIATTDEVDVYLPAGHYRLVTVTDKCRWNLTPDPIPVFGEVVIEPQPTLLQLAASPRVIAGSNAIAGGSSTSTTPTVLAPALSVTVPASGGVLLDGSFTIPGGASASVPGTVFIYRDGAQVPGWSWGIVRPTGTDPATNRFLIADVGLTPDATVTYTIGIARTSGSQPITVQTPVYLTAIEL